MRPFAIEPAEVTAEAVAGTVLCQDVVAVGDAGRVKLPKGRVLQADDVSALRTYSGELHLIAMEQGDIHEDEASIRLATAIAGPGVELRPPVESQSLMRASYRGLLEVKAGVLREINCLPDVSVFTTYDGRPVPEDLAVAAAKVTPLVVAEEVIARAENIAADHAPVVSVRPFSGVSVGVVVRDRFAGPTRDKFESAIYMKLGWFGSPVAGILYLPDDVGAIAAAMTQLIDEGVGLILAAGVNSTDPLDLTIQAMERAGGVTEKRGVPAHPGSTCWLAYVGEVPIFGLALCGMFSQTTVLDLLLPRFLSGRRVRAEDLAELGHGGLLGKDMAFRFPPYAR